MQQRLSPYIKIRNFRCNNLRHLVTETDYLFFSALACQVSAWISVRFYIITEEDLNTGVEKLSFKKQMENFVRYWKIVTECMFPGMAQRSNHVILSWYTNSQSAIFLRGFKCSIKTAYWKNCWNILYSRKHIFTSHIGNGALNFCNVK